MVEYEQSNDSYFLNNLYYVMFYKMENEHGFGWIYDGLNVSTKRKILKLDSVLVVTIFGVIPVQTLLVELDDNLRDLNIGFFSWNQISFVWSFPLDQEEKLSRVIGRSNYSLCC